MAIRADASLLASLRLGMLDTRSIDAHSGNATFRPNFRDASSPKATRIGWAIWDCLVAGHTVALTFSNSKPTHLRPRREGAARRRSLSSTSLPSQRSAASTSRGTQVHPNHSSNRRAGSSAWWSLLSLLGFRVLIVELGEGSLQIVKSLLGAVLGGWIEFPLVGTLRVIVYFFHRRVKLLVLLEI